MSLITWGGLASLLGGFFMIGFGSTSKSEEKKSDLVFFGFALLMLAVVLLGAMVINTTLSGAET